MHRLQRLIATACLLGVAALGSGAARAEPPDVVASLRPVHSLAAAVMEGVATPRLLLTGAASPHAFALKPSDMQALSDADVVFWVGPGLESFLVKPLNTIKGRRVALAEVKGLVRIPARRGGVWGDDDHDHGHGHEDGHEHDAAGDDLHYWLDPVNARLWVDAIVDALAQADEANAQTYRANGAAFKDRISALADEVAETLAPVRGVPYIVFHDAYHYFEDRFGLTPAGALSVDAGHLPGARRVVEIRRRIKQADVACVFAEPQFRSDLVDTLVRDTGVRAAILDPLGTTVPAGSDLYAALLRTMAESLRGCLAR